MTRFATTSRGLSLTIVFSLLGLLLIATPVFSQGQYYRSILTGNWSTASNWETTSDSVAGPWVVATTAPTGSEKILNSAGITITVDSAGTYPLRLSGVLKNSGVLALTGTTATFAVTSTGLYDHAINGGTLLGATWEVGSTVIVTGTTAATSIASGGSQNFYNYIWNCTAQTANTSTSWSTSTNPGVTIGGTVKILSTGSGRVQFYGSNNGSAKVMGDFYAYGTSQLAVSGSGSANLNDTINMYGNVNINTTGNVSISRGSHGNVTGSSTIWKFLGENISIVCGTMQNSDTVQTNPSKWVFAKNGGGTQYVRFTPTTVTSPKALNVEVMTGTTMQLIAPMNVITRLTLNGGKIVSSAANPLIMGWDNAGSFYSGVLDDPPYGGSATSYVDGPMSYLCATTSPKTFKYPIGKGTTYRYTKLSLTQSATTLSKYTAEVFNTAPPANTVPVSLDHVSPFRHYDITEAAGGSAFTGGSVDLSYDTDDYVTEAANTRVVQNDGAGSWLNLGGAGTVDITGTITSAVAFTDLTNGTKFTLGSTTATNLVAVVPSTDVVMASGWNLVCVPRTQTDYTATVVFPGAYGAMFTYDPDLGDYVEAPILSLGKGIWCYFTSGRTITVNGSSPTVVITCKAGWNLIGGRETVVNVSSLVLSAGYIYGAAFKYDPSIGDYVETTTLDPGDGIWLYVTQNCTITVP